MNRRITDFDEPVKAAQAALLEAFPETVALLDNEGIIVAVNQSWRRFGACNAPDGLFSGVGSNYLDACASARGANSDEAEDAAIGIRAVLDGLAPEFVLEYPCHSPDEKRWFRMIVSPVRSGRLEAALVMHVDITEHKVAAERLRENQALLSAASRVGRLGAWRLDYPGPVLTWSDEVRAIYEVPRDFFPTVQDALGFYAPECREQVRRSILTCLNEGTPFDIKAVAVTSKGRRLWVRVIGEAVRGRDGMITQLQGAFQDIDDLEVTHRELDRVSDKLASTLRSMSDAFYFVDRDWNFVFVNPGAERIFGVAAKELVGRNLWQMRPDVRGTLLEEHYRGAMAAGVARQFEVFYPPNFNWYDINAVPSPDGLGIYVREVTARKRSEEELREKQALLTMVSRVGRIGAWRLDYPDELLTWSDEVRAIHGVGPEFQPTAENLLAAYREADRRLIREALGACLAHGEAFDLKAVLVTPAGRRVSVRVIGEAVIGADGTVTCVQGGLQDITRDEETRDELDRTSGQLTSLLTHMSDAFFFVDPDWRITYVNSQAEALMRAAKSDLVGRVLWEARPFMCGTIIEQRYREAMATGVEARFEVFYDPEQNWYELHVAPSPEGMGIYFRIITRRKLADEQLAQQAARLEESRTLLYAASRVSRLGAWRLDYPGPIVTWSDDVRAIHEVAPDYQPTMENGLNFYLPEDRPLIVESVRSCLEEGRPFDVKARVRTVQDRIVWVRVIGEAVRGADGGITQVRGGFQDVTAYEETQAKVGHLERRLASTLRNMSEGFYVLDEQWKFAFLNDEAERLMQVRREDVVGRIIWEVFPGAEGLVQNHFFQAMREQRPSKFEIFFAPLDNWFEAHIFPNSEGLAVYFRPITEQKKAAELLAKQEARLRASEREYRLLFATNPQPMWVLDMETLQFLAVNTAAINHYGYAEEEFLQMTVLDIRPTEDIPRFRALLAQREMPIQTGVHNHRKKDGTLIQVEVSSDVVEFGGRQARVAMINDVTARLQAEKEARRAQRLESVGTLAGGVAHDLNNLLAPIALGIGLLKDSNQDLEILAAISTMESNARRAATVVGQLLAFARGTEGERISIQVEDTINEVLTIARNTFPKNIVIDTRVAKDLWSVLGDPTQIHQVLLNLCLNARDAMPRGGRLKIRASRAEIDEHYANMHRELKPGRFALIEVTDTGAGIDPEIIERIFEPFFTTKKVGEGSGLGLSSALGIIRAHGGFISPASKVGKGTTFKVYLPAAERPEAEPARPAATLCRGQGELVLLVDDELPILEITSKALRAFGYQVLTAEDGARAVGLFAVHYQEIALVLTDMMMAGMDGVTLIGTLKRMHPPVRVIAASGHNATDNAAAAVEAGASDFLAKPYSAESMLSAIKAVLADQPA